ncbi:putative C-_U-editing enzyme APOBEC-4 [Myiozetetes cayanensis]|uniref:putative C->U-editing enzyme APOBEC-4 n=1 Tax=Myiozetetes cayanensis TaxID=478635 RepID=UPI00215F4985|nr:putative C->U-editing enzyme APOBEC-4 [Myiozetetes cayanensis]
MNPPGEKTIFQEFLTNQGTVVKPCWWQRQCPACAKCPFHIRTGEEARVPLTEFHGLFGSPHRPAATPQNRHLLFYELRSFSGRVLQKGHATNCTARAQHPEAVLFQAGGYLDAATAACESIRCVALYSNLSPCDCCLRKMYSFLLRHPRVTLRIYFSRLYRAGNGSPGAVGDARALRSLCSLWPRVTLQRLPEGARQYLLCHFVCGITGAIPPHPALPSGASAGRQNPRQINLTGVKTYFREAFPRGMEGNPAVRQNLKVFPSPSPASRQPFPAVKGTLPPPMSPSRVLSPGVFLPSQREQLHLRPINIVRHLKMPKE